MSANPHANGGLLPPRPRSARLPRLRGRGRRPGIDVERGDARPRRLPARRDRRNPDEVPAVRPRRDGVEPARRRLRGRPTGHGWRETLPTDDHLSPDGRVMEVLSEHQCQGWLEGYLLTGRHGLLQLLRGLHPHRRLDVQPAREVAEGHARRSRGAGRSRRSTTCSPRTSGGRTTTASPTRTPGSSTTWSNKKAEIIRVYLPPDANTLLSVADHCLRSRALRERDRRRQAAGAQLPLDGGRRPPLHARASGSGSGPRTTTGRARTW